MFNEFAKDIIKIDRLEVYAYHGVYPEEKKRGQVFFINAVLYTDIHTAGRSDALENSTDYGDVCHFMSQWMQDNTFNLIEAVAENLAEAVLLKYPLISAIDVEIMKPEAPVKLPFDNISVKVSRQWHRAYLSIGSNMGDRNAYLQDAFQTLEEHPLIHVNKISDVIETEPYGNVEQDAFLNAAISVDTLLSPEDLLVALHDIENAADRKRTIHWGPRTLDLDILFYDRMVYESDALVIPHTDLHNRKFVLEPMSQLAPNYRHPIYRKTIMEMLKELEQ